MEKKKAKEAEDQMREMRKMEEQKLEEEKRKLDEQREVRTYILSIFSFTLV